MPKVMYTLRIEPELIDRVGKIAVSKKRTTANMIRYILDKYCEQVMD